MGRIRTCDLLSYSGICFTSTLANRAAVCTSGYSCFNLMTIRSNESRRSLFFCASTACVIRGSGLFLVELMRVVSCKDSALPTELTIGILFADIKRIRTFILLKESDSIDKMYPSTYIMLNGAHPRYRHEISPTTSSRMLYLS